LRTQFTKSHKPTNNWNSWGRCQLRKDNLFRTMERPTPSGSQTWLAWKSTKKQRFIAGKIIYTEGISHCNVWLSQGKSYKYSFQPQWLESCPFAPGLWHPKATEIWSNLSFLFLHRNSISSTFDCWKVGTPQIIEGWCPNFVLQLTQLAWISYLTVGIFRNSPKKLSWDWMYTRSFWHMLMKNSSAATKNPIDYSTVVIFWGFLTYLVCNSTTKWPMNCENCVLNQLGWGWFDPGLAVNPLGQTENSFHGWRFRT